MSRSCVRVRRVPRVVFVNKMDREGANWGMCLSSLRERLGAHAVPLQLPLDDMDRPAGDGAASYTGDLLDLVACELVRWKDKDGRLLDRTALSLDTDHRYARACQRQCRPGMVSLSACPGHPVQAGRVRLREHRLQMLESLAAHDDELAELLLSTERPEALPPAAVHGTRAAR